MKLPEQLSDFDPRYLSFAGLFVIPNRLETVAGRYLRELTSKQWFLLAGLEALFGGEAGISELSAALGTTHQNIKQIALKLREKGFVLLCRSETDRRVTRIVMQEKAYAYGREYQKLHAEFIDRLFSGIPPKELSAFLRTIQRLDDNLNDIQKETTT